MIFGIPIMFVFSAIFLMITLGIILHGYVIRPRVYAGETEAKVIKIDKIYWDNARVIISYIASGEKYERKISSGVYKKRKANSGVVISRSEIKPFYSLGKILIIRYKVSNPEKIYIKSDKFSVHLISILVFLGITLLCFLIGLFLN